MLVVSCNLAHHACAKKSGYTNLRLSCSTNRSTNQSLFNAAAAALAAGARAQPRVCGLLCTPSRYRTQRVAGRVTNTAPPTCARHALALALALTPVRGAGASLFFLSHMHADHLQGLHHGWSAVTTPT